MELMNSVLLALTDKVETSFNMSCFAGKFAILGDLYSCFIIDHKDGWNSREALCRFTPLFGAEVGHIIEEHTNVSSGHSSRACGHIFGFRSRHCNWCWHCRIGFDESAIVEDHVSDS